MWCETKDANLKGRLNDYITYFEGTCEFCLNNMGIQQYLSEIRTHLLKVNEYDDETCLLLYYDLGVIKFKLGELEEAYNAWQQAEKYSQRCSNEVFTAKIKSYMAIYFYASKDFEKSKEYFDAATKIFEAKELYSELSLHYVNMLWYKRYSDNQEEVLEDLDKAFKYVQKSNNPRDARVYLHLGYIYKTIFNDFIRGMKFLLTAKELCYKNGNVEMETMTMHVLADGYMRLYHYDEAIEIYTALREDRYKNITANLKCMLLPNLTLCYIKKKDYDSAEEALDSMRGCIEDAQANMREQFECVHEWLMAVLLVKCVYDLSDVPALLSEAEAIYRKYEENFHFDGFEYYRTETMGDYLMKVGMIDKALIEYEKMKELCQSRDKVCQKETYAKLANAYEMAGLHAESKEYRELEEQTFNEIEKNDTVAQYDRLYKEFLQYMNDQSKANAKGAKAEPKAEEEKDLLTGLFTRPYIEEYANKLSHIPFGRVGAVMLAVDYFQEYVKSYGRSESERCLRKVADVISTALEGVKAKACRYDDEEFLVVFRGMDEKKAKNFAEKIAASVRDSGIYHNNSPVSPYLTVSTGTYISATREDSTEVITKAEIALYEAKQRGRNSIGDKR